jgi:MoaA/NifB/PqqE/SkfB family radical SAM enzyme
MRRQPIFPYNLETHLVDHCNLNCKGCSHFAPLVRGEVFYDLNHFEEDLLALRRLFRDVYEIRLMGGEPLLHPEVSKFIKVTRQIFPNTRIAIFTNGLLLDRMPRDFWETCSTNQVQVKLTNYPVPLDLEKIKQLGKTHQVNLKIPPLISSFNQFININGDSNPEDSFKSCRARYMCPFLRDGKLYTCAFAPHVHLFNQYFDQDIPVTEKDYIDITGDISSEDVFEFLKQPTPLCRFCEVNRPPFRWDRTHREIGEWINKENLSIEPFYQLWIKQAVTIYHQIRQAIDVRRRR